MNSRTYNAQFLTIDFRLFESPDFCKLMRSAVFPVYMLLRRYVWRGVRKRHPIDKVNELYRKGYLVSAIPRTVLARKLDIRHLNNVSRILGDLVKLGLIHKVRTGRESVYVLGTWEDRSLAGDRSYVVELFRLEQQYGAEPFKQPTLDDVAPGLEDEVSATDTPEVSISDTSEVSATDTPEVSATDTSEVSKLIPINKEENREQNRYGGGSWFLPDPVGPEAVPIPIPDGSRSPPQARPPAQARSPSKDRRPSEDRRPNKDRTPSRGRPPSWDRPRYRRSVFEPIDTKERPDNVIYVEF